MSTDLADAPYDADTLQSEKTNLQSELSELRSRRDRLKEKESNLRKKVQEIHEKLSSGDLDAPPEDLADLKSERDSMKEARMAVEEKVLEAEERLSEIKAKLGSHDRVESLKEAIERCKAHRDGYEEAMETAVQTAENALEEALDELHAWREAQENFKSEVSRIFPALRSGSRDDEHRRKIRRALQALGSAGVDYEVALSNAPHWHVGHTHASTFKPTVRSEADAHDETPPFEGPIADRLYDRLEEMEEARR
jgi:chromosome segregation ATPase